jgi:hypothetical protein
MVENCDPSFLRSSTFCSQPSTPVSRVQIVPSTSSPSPCTTALVAMFYQRVSDQTLGHRAVPPHASHLPRVHKDQTRPEHHASPVENHDGDEYVVDNGVDCTIADAPRLATNNAVLKLIRSRDGKGGHCHWRFKNDVYTKTLLPGSLVWHRHLWKFFARAKSKLGWDSATTRWQESVRDAEERRGGGVSFGGGDSLVWQWARRGRGISETTSPSDFNALDRCVQHEGR